jgi:heme/copper-type cytochrome/quinol oxidase subunit 2
MPLGRALILAGIVLIVVGVLVTVAVRLPIRLGHLPGDIRIQGRRTLFYFPLTTCILLSVLLTLLIRLFRR